MSDYRAIATVTKVLERTLQAAAQQAVGAALVRTGRPEAPQGASSAGAGIDLYLYQVLPNAAFRNCDLPTRREDGTLLKRPQIGLDLHYLLTFRGDEQRLEPQRLLGNAVRALHSVPLLLPTQIETVVGDPLLDYLKDSDLASAFELVKVTPLPLSLEELSKLWSVFFQTPYNLSMAYQATVVVLEGREIPGSALPVADRRLYTIPFRSPEIDEVAASTGEAIVQGTTLVLRGRSLKGKVTRVSVRGVEVTPDSVTDGEVRIVLSSPPFPASGLQAGVQGVAVIHPIAMGSAIEHAGFESNVAAFVLRPRITLSQSPDPTHVTVSVQPPLRRDQRAVLLLNGVAGTPASAFVFESELASADTPTIAFEISDVAPGEYFVRVQIDGAESPLVLDPGSPLFGPTVIVP